MLALEREWEFYRATLHVSVLAQYNPYTYFLLTEIMILIMLTLSTFSWDAYFPVTHSAYHSSLPYMWPLYIVVKCMTHEGMWVWPTKAFEFEISTAHNDVQVL